MYLGIPKNSQKVLLKPGPRGQAAARRVGCDVPRLDRGIQSNRNKIKKGIFKSDEYMYG